MSFRHTSTLFVKLRQFSSEDGDEIVETRCNKKPRFEENKGRPMNNRKLTHTSVYETVKRISLSAAQFQVSLMIMKFMIEHLNLTLTYRFV